MQIVEELHAARVGKNVDLPVVPPSGELMSMEIDLEDDVHSSAGIPHMLMFLITCVPTFSFYHVYLENVKI
jgi:hypothetical protein